jgi:hypothetical protein
MAGSMTKDASEILVPHIRHFTIGFVFPDRPAPSVLGSGVLAAVGNAHGILTCAHVADLYSNRTEIGLLRFNRDQVDQRMKLQLGPTATIKVGKPEYQPYGRDIAFTRLADEQVGTLKATCSFINLDLNLQKFATEPLSDTRVDGIFGLVAERTEEPIKQGDVVTTPMQGLLTPGHVFELKDGTATFRPLGQNASNLPFCFGGNSGGGLWRAYLKDNGDDYEKVDIRLVGIASYQLQGTHDVVCQGVNCIEQLLLPEVRQRWG